MDLWSDDPTERLTAARDPKVVADWPVQIGASAPMRPWPYGMPTSINPFVLFLGPSPGNSPSSDDTEREAYDLPTAGKAHLKLYYLDRRRYWDRVRELGKLIVRAHAPGMGEKDTHALLGQLNLGTGQFGDAKNAPFEQAYCRWVPQAIVEHLRPSYVILLGLSSGLTQAHGGGFDPSNDLKIDWNAPDHSFPFEAYKDKQFRFRIWNRKRSDGKIVRFVMWPQHPGRAPMTKDDLWTESGHEFIRHVRSIPALVRTPGSNAGR